MVSLNEIGFEKQFKNRLLNAVHVKILMIVIDRTLIKIEITIIMKELTITNDNEKIAFLLSLVRSTRTIRFLSLKYVLRAIPKK